MNCGAPGVVHRSFKRKERMNISNLFGSIGGQIGFGGLNINTALRFLAEPGTSFSNFLGSLTTSGGLGKSLSGSGFDGQIASLEALMAKQAELQAQMQSISIVTNIMKTDHDMHMAVIRNLKVD